MPPSYNSDQRAVPAADRRSTEVPGLPPLVVDLDYTLVRTDTLIESLVLLARRQPRSLAAVPGWLLEGRDVLKARVAELVVPAPSALPFNDELLEMLRAERAQGRTLVLATAANERIADAVARHLEVFSMTLGSRVGENLKGPRKLAAIRRAVGDRFSYAGDSSADVPIWHASESAILVGATKSVRRRVCQRTPIEREFPRTTRASTWLRALRWHQWTKNVLVLIPLLTSFAFSDVSAVTRALLAFVAFSATASATYLFNDLLDVSDDRRHPTKRRRPLARGDLRLHDALAVSAVLLTGGLASAWMVGRSFMALVCCYLVLTVAYSTWLKRLLVADSICLAVLYVLRVVAGADAIGVTLSAWLAGFSVFIFFSLAILKRASEMEVMRSLGRSDAAGRAYRTDDLHALFPLGTGSGLCAVVVFGLFLAAPNTRMHYASPDVLWIGAIVLLYWISRIWIKASRGEVPDDPVVFALRDRSSRIAACLLLASVLTARYATFPSFLH